MGVPGVDAPTGGLRGLRVYADRRMLAILGMGFASGFPLVLTTSVLTYWLRELDVKKTVIGLFALVGLPYAFKFLWAPAIDQVRIPWLTRLLGRRRSWALVTQVCLLGAILGLGATDPVNAPLGTAALALVVAFLSASQDVAIDAYRIEILHEREQGAGAASTMSGYRIGLLVASNGALALSDFVPWTTVFACLAGLVSVGMLTVLLATEPPAPPGPPPSRRSGALRHAFVEPLSEFLGRPQWAGILAFALLYKFGDAISGVMTYPFYGEVGFSGVQIASVNWLGPVATIAGAFVGGALVAQAGIYRGLLAGGILQAVTNLLFALQAYVGQHLGVLALAIGTDSFTGGLASAAFVAYLSSLCRREFTGTQYALFTSLMAAGRTILSSGGGWLADQVDWVTFFVLTTALAAPGLLLLLRIGREGRSTAR